MLGTDAPRILAPRFDLGVRSLWPEWRSSFASRETLLADALHGLVVAATMLPLSLALAVLSGVPPEKGIVVAAIGSAVCVLFGGTRIALSGPGIATAMLVARAAHEHGLAAVAALSIAVGVLQVSTGVLGVGRFVRLLPISVIQGCVLGIGALMVVLQLPVALGAPLMSHEPLMERFDAIGAHLPHTNLAALAVAAASAALAIGARTLSRRAPGALVAVALATLAAVLLHLELPRLEPSTFLALDWPRLPSEDIAQLAGTAIALFLTATLGTLSSTAALEGRTSMRVDPDQELIGQGLACIACGFAGCPPATQELARSHVAAELGVARRRTSFVQAIVVLLAGAAAWPVLHHVPTAALSGVVIATAIPLLDPRPLLRTARIVRFELAIGIVTALGIAAFGVMQGIEAGLVLAVIAAAFRLARTRAIIHEGSDGAPHQVSFSGPITFLASFELEHLRRRLGRVEPSAGLVVDLRSVLAIDATGAEALLAAARAVSDRDGRISFLGPSPIVRERLIAADAAIASRIATSAREIEALLEKDAGVMGRPNLLAGVAHFQAEMREHYDALFDQLADGQHPHTMFITCADSRINPSLLMGSHPGDLFIVRCIGALVPPAHSEHMPQEGAAIEYGVGVLGVRHVIVCGHSKCGAISALKRGNLPERLETLGQWSKHASEVAGDLDPFDDVDVAARAVTVRQLEHVKSYALVRDQIDKGELHVHAWFYDLDVVELLEYDEVKRGFAPLGPAAKE